MQIYEITLKEADGDTSQQQMWDKEYRRLKNQYPKLTSQEYQKAMLKRMGTARPGRSTTSTQSTTNTGTVVATTPHGQPPATTTPATQHPPITLGTGPGAQVFINKGRGYIDKKTGKPMPPAIVKAMGL